MGRERTAKCHLICLCVRARVTWIIHVRSCERHDNDDDDDDDDGSRTKLAD